MRFGNLGFFSLNNHGPFQIVTRDTLRFQNVVVTNVKVLHFDSTPATPGDRDPARARARA